MSKKVQWTGHDENMWHPVGHSTSTLKPALYTVSIGPGFWFLKETTFKHDNIVRLGVADTLFKAIESFWAQRDTYKKLGFLHKCGFLLAGPPGTGKTLAATIACTELIAKGGATFILPPNLSGHPNLMVDALKAAREVHPDMPLAAIWEDIDSTCGEDGDSDDRAVMTSLLDGETQIDNVVHIATTNYYDKLDKAFRNRPGRFNVLWVGPPSREVRLAYLKAVIPHGDPKLIEELATKSDGFILDHVKSMLVSVFIHGESVDNVVAHLKEMNFKSDNAPPQLTFKSIFGPLFGSVGPSGRA